MNRMETDLHKIYRYFCLGNEISISKLDMNFEIETCESVKMVKIHNKLQAFDICKNDGWNSTQTSMKSEKMCVSDFSGVEAIIIDAKY